MFKFVNLDGLDTVARADSITGCKVKMFLQTNWFLGCDFVYPKTVSISQIKIYLGLVEIVTD